MRSMLRLLFYCWVLPALGKFGVAFEVISGSVAAAGGVFTAWTMNAGDSSILRACDVSKKIWLVDMWALNDTAAGVLRIHSPRMHDNVQGIRQRIVNNNCEPLLTGAGTTAIPQRLYSQDALIIEQTGSAANKDTGHFTVLYDDLPGTAARLIDNAALIAAGVNRIGQEVTVATGAGVVTYTGAVALNSSNPNLKANTDYALIGLTVDTRSGVIGIKGADVGNLRIGVPGEPSQRHITTNYFQRLSDALKRPMIPVFNSANQGSINIDATGQTGALAAIVIELQMVELAAKSGQSSGGQYGI
jgi:hypothetical protein